jgi:hypothetical protein
MRLRVIIVKIAAAAITLPVGVTILLITPIIQIAWRATPTKPLQAITVICALAAITPKAGLTTISTIRVLWIVYPVIQLQQITIVVNAQSAITPRIGAISSSYIRALIQTVPVAIKPLLVTGPANAGIATRALRTG